jgi:crotonobetainyl-CoA:carnitine CoA-transferase CaiB-like acyl-CoA transferase
MWALGGELGQQALGGSPKPPRPRNASRTPMYNSYCTADGHWFFLVGVEAKRHLPSVLRAIGRPELVEDARFADARGIGKHSEELICIFDGAFNAQPLAYWRAVFDQYDVWWAPVQTPAEVMDDAQAQAIGAWVEVQGIRSVDAPVRFDFVNRQSAPLPPEVGQHTREVLAECGWDAAGIAAVERTNRGSEA